MKPLWHKLFRASLLAPALAAGCRHVEHTSDCPTCHARAPLASAVASPSVPMSADGYNTVRANPVMSIPPADPVVSAPPAVLPVVPAPLPVVTAPASSEPDATPLPTTQAQRMPTGGDAVVHGAGPMDRPQTSVSMKVAELPTTVIGDTDAKPAPAPTLVPGTSVSTPHPLGYAHALDYSLLVGELNYNPRQRTWRLRYTTVDDEDRYGGSVTLTGAEPMLRDCKDGQVVRVHGSLADPDSHLPSPAYRVTELEVVGSSH